MKIGILAAGDTPRSLAETYGHYPEMFEGLLAGRGYAWQVFDVPNGKYPARPEDCDGYLVTGAAAGVYDPDPWIAELLQFLRAARGRSKLVGVCFGHQAMAQAFGGEVIKSPKGWGIGLHTYGVRAQRDWMNLPPAFSLSASHQDQVAVVPPDAVVLAGSEFCPNGMLAYGDNAISLQLHPEFAPDYSTALIEARQRVGRLPEGLATQAIESLQRPDDHARMAGWIGRFLEG
jgi:GMP synthase-like glutamine amidotransferase